MRPFGSMEALLCPVPGLLGLVHSGCAGGTFTITRFFEQEHRCIMNSDKLRQLQAPLKSQYRETPETAIAELSAKGTVDLKSLTCAVAPVFSGEGTTVSGLHPKAGGDGSAACSGDMLLQSLVACSGVTLAAVATAMGLNISSAAVGVKGTMDFRGTLGVDRNTPVGLTEIVLTFDIDSNEPPEQLDRLVELTERYCVVLQTLKHGVSVKTTRN